jgi:hypothetical protein
MCFIFLRERGSVWHRIVNILAITSLTLLLLIFVAIIINGVSAHDIGEEYIRVSIFLQILAANTLIIGGLQFIQRIKSKYAILEFLIGVGYVIIVLLVFGTIFDWLVFNRVMDSCSNGICGVYIHSFNQYC